MKPTSFTPHEHSQPVPTDAHLDAFAAGTLSPHERAWVEAWLDADLAEGDAAPLAAALRATPTPAAPPSLARAALRSARADLRRARWEHLAEAMASAWNALGASARPAFAGAALVAAVALAGVLGRGEHAPTPHAQTEAQQVAQALEDAHIAFAYLGAASERASRAVQRDLDAHVAQPLEDALAHPFGLTVD